MSSLYTDGLRVNGMRLSCLTGAKRIYEIVIDVLMYRVRQFTTTRLYCEGCVNNWPSQRDHDCLMLFDEYFELYLTEALEKMDYDILCELIRTELVEKNIMHSNGTVSFLKRDLADDVKVKYHILYMYHTGLLPD